MIRHSHAAVSFRDPAGFVCEVGGELCRQVNLVYRDHYDRLMSSGLYDELVGRGLLVPHEELADPAPDPQLAYKLLRPERIDFVSYPYEWSFSQLRDAALLALEVERRALARGMTLKDCSAYNVQFYRGRPVLIDTLSFEVVRAGEPWAGYRQFCEHFLAPLALMSLCDCRLGQLCRTNIDGIPVDLVSRLLPRRSRLRFGLGIHIHLHSWMQGSHAHRGSKASSGGIRTGALLALVDSLESTVRRLRWKPKGNGWASYYDQHSYAPAEFEHKTRLIAEFLERTDSKRVWDLGANTGYFSLLACERGLRAVSFDSEPACIERLYLEAKRRGETKLLPLVLDLFNPSPASGWLNQERSSIFDRGKPDLVLALALVHHLALVGNQPLENLADFFTRLGPWLVIEFVPESDPQAQSLIAGRRGIHHPYNRECFEEAFQRRFATIVSESVSQSGRTLYLMRRRSDEA
jgi:hypothetical protein